MVNYKLILFLALMFTWNLVQSQNYILSGRVSDAKNGEFLPGATIFVQETNTGISTNRYGFYSLSFQEGTYIITISYVGYESMNCRLLIEKDSILNIVLKPGVEFDEIVIRSSSRAGVFSPISGAHRLSAKIINEYPVVFGEKDVLKTLQSFPGVKGGNEGTSGIQVRGGSHDQNLILLDGVPVYNTNHLFGYLSTFNADAIKDVQFFKGSIPARYGGRLSSVVDVSVKEGNIKENSGAIWVSPVAGGLLFEGPIKRDKISYLISYRRSWLDIPFSILQLLQNNDEHLSYSFNDFNGKINWKLSPKSQLYLSHYQGKDGYRYKDEKQEYSYGYSWGNNTTLMRWNYQLTPRLFINTSAYYSVFQFEEFTDQKMGQAYLEEIGSGIKDLSIKSDVDLSILNHNMKFGYHVEYQIFNPEILKIQNVDLDTIFNVAAIKHVTSISSYIEDRISILDNITILPGIRAVSYVIDRNNDIYLEPRLSMSYRIANSSSIKLSGQKMTQAIHFLTNTALNMPTDLWVPSTGNVKPEIGWQYDLAYAKKFLNYFFTLDIYYKTIRNTVQYKQGTSFSKKNSDSWEELIDIGEGLSYGTEIMLEKRNGKLTGWVNYTLAWAWRRIESINNGEYFPFKYDRRHDLNILLKYSIELSKEKERFFSASFKLASGNAITIPVESIKGTTLPGLEKLDDAYNVDFLDYQSFPYPNNYRMPLFHHLDLAYSTCKVLNEGKKRTWKFSVYNVYNRKNPYYFIKRYDSYYKVSLLPIIPSVSYSYSW